MASARIRVVDMSETRTEGLKSMAKRALRLVKNLGRTPAAAVCTVCGKTFEVPLGALGSIEDAEANLQQQFYGHKCERKDSPPDYRADSKGRAIAHCRNVDAKRKAKVEAPNLERVGRDRGIPGPDRLCGSTLAEIGNAGYSRRTVGLRFFRDTDRMGWHGTRQEKPCLHCQRRRGSGCGSQARSFVHSEATEEGEALVR